MRGLGCRISDASSRLQCSRHLGAGLTLLAVSFSSHWQQTVVAEQRWARTTCLLMPGCGCRGTIMTFNKTARTMPLPPLVVAGGHVAFEQRLPELLGVTPYALHATFQVRMMLIKPPTDGCWIERVTVLC